MFDPNVMIGTTVEGRYKLASLAGTGSYGSVYAADEIAFGEVVGQVAVKLLRPPDDSARQAIVREVQAMAQLAHPHLLAYRAAGEVTEGLACGCLYIAMELASGSLADRLRRPQRMMPEEVTDVALNLAGALSHLANRKTVHRDVKPGNILRVGDVWKLGDFGLVRGIAESRVQASACKDTILYMSPEAMNGETGPFVDVWALGVVLQECLTGSFPYNGGSNTEIIADALSNDPIIEQGLPEPYDKVVRGCLRKDRRTRMTAEQVLEVLDAKSAQPIILSPPPDFFLVPPQLNLGDIQANKDAFLRFRLVAETQLDLALDSLQAMDVTPKRIFPGMNIVNVLIPGDGLRLGATVQGNLVIRTGLSRMDVSITGHVTSQGRHGSLAALVPEDFTCVCDALAELSEKGTVSLWVSEHTEKISIDKPVMLSGMPNKRTVLQVDEGPALVLGRGAIVTDMDIRCAKGPAVVCSGGVIEMRRCSVSASHGEGVVAQALSTLHIERSEISGCHGYGVHVDVGAHVEMNECTIHHNRKTNCMIDTLAQLDMVRCDVQASPGGSGLHVGGKARLADCLVSGNGTWDVFVGNTGQLDVNGGHIAGEGGRGVRVVAGGRVKIVGKVFFENGRKTMLVEPGAVLEMSPHP